VGPMRMHYASTLYNFSMATLVPFGMSINQSIFLEWLKLKTTAKTTVKNVQLVSIVS